MKKHLLSVILLLLCLVAAAGCAEAPETADAVPFESFRIQLFSEPQIIKLPKTVTSYWFMVPSGSEIDEASLSLVLETSDTLLGDYSTATVEVNGIALSSVNLLKLRETSGTRWDIPIPVDFLKTDGTLNQLSICTAQRSILGDCADIDNPANWLTISDQSALLLSLRNADLTALSSVYPFLFNRADLGNHLSTEFVLCGSDPRAEEEGALRIASAVGAAYPYKDLENILLTRGASGSIQNSGFLIDADSSSPALQNGEGRLAVSRENGATVIQVSGGQAEGLGKAVSVLCNPALLSQFSSDSAVLRHQAPAAGRRLAAREEGLYTLEDFGYDSMNLAGAFHQQTTFTVRQPDGLLGGPGSYFEVHFRHSDALLSDSSLLTVLFDGVPASSIQLSRMNVAGGSLRVSIPQESLDKGSFDITVDVYNYLGKIDCSKDWYDVAWTVIGCDSVVYLEPSDRTVLPSLSRFPSLWGNEILLCLPEETSDEVFRSMAALALRNGQHTQSASDFRVVNSLDGMDGTALENTDLILAGRADLIRLPEAIRNELYVIPENGAWQVQKGVSTIPEALENKVIIQAVRSPYNYRRTACVILWTDDRQEADLSSFVFDADRLSSLSGELALISPAGGDVSLNAASERDAAVPLSVDSVMGRAVHATGISRLGLIIIAVLVLLILLLIIRQIRMRNRFSAAKAKMEKQNEQPENSPSPSSSGEDPDDFDQDPE